ncbi:MAG: hypothetical protein ACF8R7_06900 [Phycisphaerales bacterium JB039]
MRTVHTALLTALAITAAAGHARAQCPPTTLDPIWTGDFATEGLNDEVFAAAAWDPDGPGPLPERLVVGGAFTGAGDTRAPLVAMFVDGAWAPLDPDGLPAGGYVPAMAVADLDNDPATPASLYAAVWSGGVHAVYENRGSGWAKLPTPLLVDIAAMTEFDADGPGGDAPVLACAVDENPMAQTWDGSRWRVIGVSAPDTRVFTIARLPRASGELLVIGGRFERQFGGQTARHVAAWDGSQWLALPGGPDDGDVSGMGVHDPDGAGPLPHALYITGRFSTIGGGTPAGVAQWDGAQWSPVPGSPDFAYPMLSFDPDGAGPAERVLAAVSSSVHWLDAGVWRESLRMSSNAWAAAAIDLDGPGPQPPAVAIGGRFGGIYDSTVDAISAPHTAIWDPAGNLRPLGPSATRGLDHQVERIVAWNRPGKSPVIAAQGRFYSAGGAPAYRAALWDGDAWSAIPGLGTAAPTAIATGAAGADPDQELLLLGNDYGGVWSHDGDTPTELRKSSFPARYTIVDLAVYDPDGAGPAPRNVYIIVDSSRGIILRLDETLGWVEVTGSGGFDFYDLQVFDADGPGPGNPVLLAAGYFSGAAVKQWDGAAWTSLGGDRDTIETLLAVPTDAGPTELYGAGPEGVWHWIGSGWALLGPDFGAGSLVDDVQSLAAWPTGPGEFALFAGGSFDIGSGPRVNLARFDGVRWVTAAPGRDAPGGPMDINTMLTIPCGADLPPGLYAGGAFTRFGDQSAMFIARAVFGECYADCDGTGELDFFDFLCFQNAFATGDLYADCDGTGALDFFDFLCFQNAFAAGCP